MKRTPRQPTLASSPSSTLAAKSDPRIAQLPKVPRALAERLGYGVGLQLMAKFGGTQIRVPADANRVAVSVIARTLGEDAARVLCELHGGDSIEIPIGIRARSTGLRRAILEHPGSNNEVALELGVTRRWVRMVRGGARAAKRSALREAFESDEERLANAAAGISRSNFARKKGAGTAQGT